MNKEEINDDNASNSAPIPTSIPPPIIATGNPIKTNFAHFYWESNSSGLWEMKCLYYSGEDGIKYVYTFPRTDNCEECSDKHSLKFQREQQSRYENICLVIRTIRNEVTAQQSHRDTEKYITISEWSLEEDEDAE